MLMEEEFFLSKKRLIPKYSYKIFKMVLVGVWGGGVVCFGFFVRTAGNVCRPLMNLTSVYKE